MRKNVVAALALCAGAIAAPASAQTVAGVFGQGRTHFVVSGGTGYAFNESYFVLGLGASYYLMDGLAVGLNFESWTGSDPKMTKITASTQYVFYKVDPIKPYVGAFYRRTNISGLDDLDSVGARAGAYLRAGNNLYFGLGGVYESYLDCQSSVYRKCDSTYAELTFTVAF